MNLRSRLKCIILIGKEIHSPDGDSTTAPPSQASEHSEAKAKIDRNSKGGLNDFIINDEVDDDEEDEEEDKIHMPMNDVSRMKKVIPNLFI